MPFTLTDYWMERDAAGTATPIVGAVVSAQAENPDYQENIGGTWETIARTVLRDDTDINGQWSFVLPQAGTGYAPADMRFFVTLPNGTIIGGTVPSAVSSGNVHDLLTLYGWSVAQRGDLLYRLVQGPRGEDGNPGPVVVNPRGVWNNATTYAQYDQVNYLGDSWYSLQNGNLNHTPAEGAWWTLIASKGDPGGNESAFEYFVADYATPNLAATAVQTAGGGTLIIDDVHAVAAGFTVSAQVELRFTGKGRLEPATGQTVTINGPINAARRQIFGGAGVVQLGGYQTQDEACIEWWGAKGDGAWTQGSASAFSADAMQAAINAVPSWGGPHVTAGAGTFLFDKSVSAIYTTSGAKRQANLTIRAVGGRIGGTTSPTGRGTTFLWDSATAAYTSGSNTGCLLNLHSRECSIEGITFGPCNGRTLFACVDIDRDPLDTTGNTCTKNRFIDCHFTSGAGEGKTGTLTHGVQIAAGGYVNCDQMLFRDCQFSYHTEAGFYSPNTTWQSKEHWFEHCEFTAGKYAVRMATGSANFLDPHFYSQTVTAVRIDSSLDSLSFYGIESEGCKQLLSCGLANGSVGFYGGRIACDAVTVDPATVQASFLYAGSAHVALYGVRFDGSQHAGFGGMYSLTSMGSTLPNLDPLAFNGQGDSVKRWRLNCAGLSPITGDLVALQDLWTGSNDRNAAPGLTMTGPLLVDSGTAHPFAITNNPPDGSQARSTASATGGALLAGHFYQYAVTYVTAAGETQSAGIANIPTPGTAGVSPDTCSIAITGIPKGPPGTQDRKLYRFGPDGSPVWKVRTIVGNSATTFTDTDAGWSASGGTPGSDTSGLSTVQAGMLKSDYVRVAADAGTAFAPTDFLTVDRAGATRYLPLTSNVGSLISGGGALAYLSNTFATKTANYTITDADGTIEVNAASKTITLPVASGRAGHIHMISNGASGSSTTVNVTSSGTINGATTFTGLTAAYSSAIFQSTGSEWRVY